MADTLIREVQEETGYRVIADSIRDYILVHEKRKSDLDEYEQEYDYQVAWLPLSDIIHKNESVKEYGKIPWIVRETMVMHEVQEMEGRM